MCGEKNERSLMYFLCQRQRRRRSDDACMMIGSKTYLFPWITIYQRVSIFVMILAPRVTFF
jgi:hypothetical protein